MEFRTALQSTLVLLAASSMAVVLWSQEPEARVVGNVHIPDTSIERPEHIGVQSHTNHRILITPAGGLGPNGGMTPTQIRAFYGVPANGGQGVIAIVDAYNYPTALADFNTFASYFGLPIETSTNATASTNKVFQVVYASGKKPSGNGGWNQEAALDIEWAHAMAPNAKIVLVEATSATNANLFAAVKVAAAIAGVEEVSMSWGGSETSGETSYDADFNVNGPVFFASAGDAGGVVEYPSCSPYVAAAGGTSVATNSSGALTSESAWADGGGGNSKYEKKPSWQAGVAMSGSDRGVPDLSSDADPNTGVCVYDSTSYQGYKGWMVFGGTSVSSPSLAGMLNATGLTFANTTAFLTALYNNYKNTPTVFRDITTGSNGFPATVGWDYATGVGAPTGSDSF